MYARRARLVCLTQAAFEIDSSFDGIRFAKLNLNDFLNFKCPVRKCPVTELRQCRFSLVVSRKNQRDEDNAVVFKQKVLHNFTLAKRFGEESTRAQDWFRVSVGAMGARQPHRVVAHAGDSLTHGIEFSISWCKGLSVSLTSTMQATIDVDSIFFGTDFSFSC